MQILGCLYSSAFSCFTSGSGRYGLVKNLVALRYGLEFVPYFPAIEAMVLSLCLATLFILQVTLPAMSLSSTLPTCSSDPMLKWAWCSQRWMLKLETTTFLRSDTCPPSCLMLSLAEVSFVWIMLLAGAAGRRLHGKKKGKHYVLMCMWILFYPVM